MFSYKRTIFLRETDATGVLYFSEQFKLALEAMEAYFSSVNFKLQVMIDESDFLMPIVHADADFSSPMRVGDEIEILLSLKKIGTSSFTLNTLIKDGSQKEIGRVSIVHVCVSKASGKPIPLPDEVKLPLTKI